MIEGVGRALVLGAHPDDEMGCAGTVARLVEDGTLVDLLTFSRCSDLIPKGYIVDDLVEEWMTSASHVLHMNEIHILDIPNRRFPEFRQAILSELDRHRGYDLVFAPASSDAHQDHSTVMAETIRVFKHAKILGYELPMNTVRQSVWAAYARLDERHVDTKIEVVKTYKTQAFRPYMTEEFIRGIVSVRGVQAGTRYAEAFEVVRWVM